MKKTLIGLFVLSLTATSALANEQIIRNYRSIRSQGMGGLTTTTGMYDDALFGNPARHGMNDTWKVQLLSPTVEVNSNVITDIPKFSDVAGAKGEDIIAELSEADLLGRNEHLRIANVTGVYIPRFLSQNNGFAFGMLTSMQTDFMLRSSAEIDTLLLIDVGPAAGFARKFFDQRLAVGVNVRGIYRLAADTAVSAVDLLGGKDLTPEDIGGQGFGFDADFGVMYDLPWELDFVRFSVGGSGNNLLASKYNNGGQVIENVTSLPPPNDRSFNVGFRADFADWKILSNSLLAFEIQDIGENQKLVSTWKRIHMGGETRLTRFLSLRAGVNQGYWTAGVGVNLPILKVDLASYGEEIGSNAGMMEDRRYALKLGLEI